MLQERNTCEVSSVRMEAAMTDRETPHARPRACFEGTNTYCTFCEKGKNCSGKRTIAEVTLSSHNSGRCSKMARGSVSAARMMRSEMPRLSVLVAAKTQ